MGHVVYTGPPQGAVPWFKTLGYEYVPVRDGSASDWLIDLVSVGFDKPQVSRQPQALPCTAAYGSASGLASQRQPPARRLALRMLWREERSQGHGSRVPAARLLAPMVCL